MKDLKLLVWLTQLGLSVALPPAGLIWLAVWLRDSRGWGNWVIWVGIIAGAVLTVNSLRTSLKTLDRLTRPQKDCPPPPASFNGHD